MCVCAYVHVRAYMHVCVCMCILCAQHITVTCPFACHAAQVTDGERFDRGCGQHTVILDSELDLSVANHCLYLKDDCLIFRVTSIKLS